MKVLVCGGREYRNFEKICEVLDGLPIDFLIHGAARGADELAALWARRRKIKAKGVPADWRRYGQAAGMMRNALMLEKYKPDLIVAFPGGAGTEDMCTRGEDEGVKVLRVERE